MAGRFALVSHPGPLSDERSIEAWTYIDESYGSGWEKLFVAPAGPEAWRLCNLPHHVYGLKVGATVRVDRHGRIAGLIANPDGPAFRLRLREPGVREACLASLSPFLVEPMSGSFIGVQARDGQPPGTLESAVSGLMSAGLVLDTEDVLSSAFDPGPEPTDPAPSGDGPRVHDPAREDCVMQAGLGEASRQKDPVAVHLGRGSGWSNDP